MTNRRELLCLAVVLVCASCAGEGVEAPRAVREPTGRSELGVFMKGSMNPPFSKLSFLLFHNDADDQPAADLLPTAASELSRAASTLAAWSDAPGQSEQGRSVFHDYAQALKSDAADLETAVRLNRKDAAVKAFETLRRKCDSCHHFFRFDESASLDVRVQVADGR